jgi:Tfp pilus assembly protein PilN
MTAVMSHPDQKPDQAEQHTATLLNPLRTPTVSADLLPVEVFVSRRTRRIGRYAGFALVIVTVLLALWYGLEILRTTAAETDRDATLGTVQDLKRKQARYDELVKTQATAKAINAQLVALMSNDMLWSTLTRSMVAAAPDDVKIGAISAAVPAAGANAAVAKSLIGPPTVKLIGSLTVNGVGDDKEVIALYVDALDTVPGLANAFLTSATQSEKGFEFAVRVDITSAALDNRYKASASASAGAGQ